MCHTVLQLEWESNTMFLDRLMRSIITHSNENEKEYNKYIDLFKTIILWIIMLSFSLLVGMAFAYYI